MSGRTALGLRAQRGGSLVVGVTGEAREVRVVLSTVLPTAAEGDRLAFEPYHVAYETPRGPNGEVALEAIEAVAEGRRRQQSMAAKGLADILQRLRGDGLEPELAALLMNRAGWMTDLLAHALSAPEHPPVIEGLAVRDALRFACGQCGLAIAEMDEKSLPETAAARLGLSPADMDRALGELGVAAGRPWRKEQKLACLAAWMAIT